MGQSKRLPCKKALGCHPVAHHVAQAGEIVGAAEAVGGAAATAYGAYNHDQSVQDAGEAAMGVGAATGLGSHAVAKNTQGPVPGRLYAPAPKHGRKVAEASLGKEGPHDGRPRHSPEEWFHGGLWKDGRWRRRTLQQLHGSSGAIRLRRTTRALSREGTTRQIQWQ